MMIQIELQKALNYYILIGVLFYFSFIKQLCYNMEIAEWLHLQVSRNDLNFKKSLGEKHSLKQKLGVSSNHFVAEQFFSQNRDR